MNAKTIDFDSRPETKLKLADFGLSSHVGTWSLPLARCQVCVGGC